MRSESKKEYMKKWWERNKHKRVIYYKRRKAKEPEKIKWYIKKYQIEHKEEIKKRKRNIYIKNRNTVLLKNKEYRKNCKEKYVNNFMTIKPTKRKKDKDGYIELCFNGYITKEHIHFMRKKLRWCFMGKDGEINHKNGIRDDNWPDNLEFIPKDPIKKQHRLKDNNVKLTIENLKLKEENERLRCELLAVNQAKNF